MNKFLKMIIASCLLFIATVGTTSAHLIAFAWDDLGNGTIRMYGQHWHGDQSTAFSDNGGVRIGVWNTALSAALQDTSSWQLFQWTGFINNMGGNTTQNDALVTAGTIDGYAIDPGNWSNSSSQNDWFYTDPLVLGNGNWGLFTGTQCCVDTMSVPGLFNVSGISSVPVGTGPGQATVPEPATLALLSLGLMGLVRRKSN